MDDFFYDRYDRLVRPIREGRNLTELYSFISSKERDRFPDGELILVRYEAILRPDRGEDVRLRRFLYREPGGRIRSMTWDEERFQIMLAKTGITIPPPQPLPPVPQRSQRNSGQPSPQPLDPESEAIEEQPAPLDTLRSPERPTERPQDAPFQDEAEDSGSPNLLWLTGGVVALLVLLFGWRKRRRGHAG